MYLDEQTVLLLASQTSINYAEIVTITLQDVMPLCQMVYNSDLASVQFMELFTVSIEFTEVP